MRILVVVVVRVPVVAMSAVAEGTINRGSDGATSGRDGDEGRIEGSQEKGIQHGRLQNDRLGNVFMLETQVFHHKLGSLEELAAVHTAVSPLVHLGNMLFQ